MTAIRPRLRTPARATVRPPSAVRRWALAAAPALAGWPWLPWLGAPQAAVAAPVCALPPAVGDGAVLAGGESGAWDTAALCASLQGLATPEANLHGVLVERGGALHLEAHFDGTDHPGGAWFSRPVSYTPQDLHDLRSVTKSVLALLVGIAHDRGVFGPPDTPVLRYFPEHADLQGTPKAGITLAHLLGMSSGLAWDESGSYLRWGNSETQMRLAADPWRYVLSQPMAEIPGSRFNYNGGGSALLGEALSRAVGQPLERFADEALFQPLGIRAFEWRRFAGGRVTPFGGLRLRPRDMAKIGRLVLDRGHWQGRPVVSAAWVAEMVRDRLPAGALRYGWHWWRGQVRTAQGSADYIAAFGNGGQRIYLVPRLDLVVVVTAGQYNQDTSWRAPLRALHLVAGAMAWPPA